MIRELIRSPREYFSQRIKYPQLRTQAIIVALAGFLANAWYLTLYDILGASSTYIESVILLFTFGGIIEFLFWWVVLTALMNLIANLQGGDSTFGRLLRLTGYGFVPMAVAGAIWSAGYYLALRGITEAPAPPEAPSFFFRYQSFSRFMEQVAGDPFILGGLVLGSLFVLAAGYLWVQGVVVSAEIEEDQAGIAAGIAVAVFLARIFIPVV